MVTMSFRNALRYAAVSALLTLGSIAMFAQDDQQPSKLDIFAGYSYLNPRGEGVDPIVGPIRVKDITTGFSSNVTYYFNRWAGLTFDGGGHFSDPNTIGTAMAGPTVRFPTANHVTPFLHALVGLHRLDLTGFPTDNGIGVTAGGGLDFSTRWPKLAIRLVQADMQYAHHPLSQFVHIDQVGARLSTGIVWKLGTIGPPPVPPSAACKADPAEVFEGEPVTITATTQNFNPKHKLTYTWSGAQGVNVKGAETTATVDTKGLQPGSYPVKVTVVDKKLTAECTANVVIKQPRPPQITCSANPTTVKPGETATISCQGTSPDNRPLKYTHQASAGQITPQEANATLNTQGAQPGAVTVTSTVTDDRNLSANTSTTVNVEAPPPPPPPTYPEPTPIEKRLALHSVYFSTALPTKANPKGGLVASQQRILLDLAKDFKSYLADHPDARLKLEAHADQRGSDAYNQALTERRAGAVKALLVKNGIPEANIDTEAFGKQQNLTADQVQQQIASDPQLTPGERQRITKNMKTIVLANNRRVDIVLQIPGRPPEASIRQYPFNSADALSLIGGREKPTTTKKPTKKGAKKAVPKKKQ
jgi:outer membrane protein OmpA-like peptidoglycan-associated protein